MAWGPLNDKGKPVSKDKGADYLNWVQTVKSFGYWYGFRLLNAADFGAYTNRVRYFGQFGKKVNTRLKVRDNYDPAYYVWPTPTHTKGGCEHLKPYAKVKDVLDLSDKGNSIFNRKKPLVESTLKRIYAGLVKFVAKGKADAYLCSYYGGHLGSDRSRDLDQPCPTLVTRNNHCIVSPAFISKAFGGSPEGKSISLNGPSGTITTIDHHQPVFISKYYGNGDNNSSLEEPCGTLTTVDRMAMVTATPELKESQFLLNPGWFGDAHSTDKPSPTIIASQHKAPLSIAMCSEGKAVEIVEADSPTMVQIKKFCQAYGIADISMRMLKVPELLRIQGFPENYILIGTDADKKKFIGNSVVPQVATAIAVANRKVQFGFKTLS